MKKRMSLYQCIWIFTIASLFGFILETVWYFIRRGYIINRQGMIYGPFSQIYGFGAVIVCLCLYKMKKPSSTVVFASAAIIGSLFEYFTSFFQELIFGVVSWDYSNQLMNINGRISIVMGLVWGIIGLLFMRYIFPFFTRIIESIPRQAGVWLAIALTIFFVFDLSLSGMALHRQNQRRMGIEATTSIQIYLDEKFPDERLNNIYSTAKVVENTALSAYIKNKVISNE